MKSIVSRTSIATAAAVLSLAFSGSTGSAQSSGDWKPLFNGKDLAGWTVAAGRGNPNAPAGTPAPQPAQGKVEDGVLIGGQGTGRGSLVSAEKYKDFELDLEFMLAEPGKKCSAELVGPNQENASEDKSCLYNSGISFRTGYQVNIGRREAGEFIGIVVHRVHPNAIRKNVLWLDKGDEKFPGLRKTEDWNRLQIMAKGPHITVNLNGTKIADIQDNPTDPAEAAWKEAGPISLQWPPAGESGGAQGFIKYRNVKIRTL